MFAKSSERKVLQIQTGGFYLFFLGGRLVCPQKSTCVESLADSTTQVPTKIFLNQPSDIFIRSMKNSILREPTSTNPTGLSLSQEQYWNEQSIWQDKVWSVLSRGECRMSYQHIPDLFLRHILIEYILYPDFGKDWLEFSTSMDGMVT